MFQFPGCPPHDLWIQSWVMESSSIGFPHSDVCGSMLACSSPQLIAACHVLRRRMVPWHPPCALISLIFSSLVLRPIVSLLSSYALHLISQASLILRFATGLSLNHSLCSCQGAFHRTLKTIQVPTPQLPFNSSSSRRAVRLLHDLLSFFTQEFVLAFLMLR